MKYLTNYFCNRLFSATMQNNKQIDGMMLIDDSDDIHSSTFQQKKISTRKLLRIYQLITIISLILFLICLIILFVTLFRKKQHPHRNNSTCKCISIQGKDN